MQANDKAMGLGVVGGGVTAVLGGDAFDQGQAQAGAAGVLVIRAPKALKYMGQLFGRNTGAVVGHFEDDGVQAGRGGARAVIAIAAGVRMAWLRLAGAARSEEHTSELQSR